MVDALALRGDEGRESCDKLREECKYRYDRRFPNGAT